MRSGSTVQWPIWWDLSMRDVIWTTVNALGLPSAEDRAEASANWGNRTANDRYQTTWPCLNAIELAQPPDLAPSPAKLTVTAWNIERCKWVEPSAELIRRVSADVVLATEVDLGMARSGQRHTTRDLAEALGFGFGFGVEFVELGLGDANETVECAGQTNLHGLHGNAILSRYPLRDVALIPLDAGGYWFVQAPKNDGQYRVGGRMAIAARIDTGNGPLVLCAVHYESESDAAGRAAQTETMLKTLDALYGSGSAIIGGDLNTKGFLEAGMTGGQTLADPYKVEPSFRHFENHGFDWRASNTGEVTTRLQPTNPPDWPLKTIDWLFMRGVAAADPFVTPALSKSGEYLSDHELIGATIRP
jgi:endonuclease/exonuclease/phosphatase family metal-dependent hydrolase